MKEVYRNTKKRFRAEDKMLQKAGMLNKEGDDEVQEDHYTLKRLR